MREYLLFLNSPQNEWQKKAEKESEAVLRSIRNLCAKFLEDCTVDDGEAALLYENVMESAGLLPKIGLGNLPTRLKSIFEDGMVDHEEREELKLIAEEIVRCVDEPRLKPRVAGLPYSQPQPFVLAEKVVVISGLFQFGKRSKVEESLDSAGASVEPSVTQSTHYVIVGAAPSQGWAHGNYGRKIEDALQLQSKGFPIQIIQEMYWRTTA